MNKKEVSTFSSRLLFALNQLGVSQAELARRINVKRQAIQYLCASKTNKSKFSYDIAEALAINVEWLVANKGEMRLQPSPEQRVLAEHKIVPILNWNQITDWLNNKTDKSLITDWTTVHGAADTNTFALKLKDNSMYPRFDSETLIIVNPQIAPSPPCFVLAFVERMHDVVFRLLEKNGDEMTLFAFNETGYSKIILQEADKILGCMIEAKWTAP